MPEMVCWACGAKLVPAPGALVYTCDHCQQKLFVPKSGYAKKQSVLNNASELLACGAFDDALVLFAEVAAKDPREVNAYWGQLLCEYGILYADDPVSRIRQPLCLRAKRKSMIDDSLFERAYGCADNEVRRIIREEIGVLEEQRRRNCEILAGNPSYRIFINCRTSNDASRTTRENRVAMALYQELTARGIRTFYAPAVLVGRQKDDHAAVIYSAMESANLMLVIGEEPASFTQPEVKAEWTFFTRLMNLSNQKKQLISICCNTSAASLPEALAALPVQAFKSEESVSNLINKLHIIDDPHPDNHRQKLAAVRKRAELLSMRIEECSDQAFVLDSDGKLLCTVFPNDSLAIIHEREIKKSRCMQWKTPLLSFHSNYNCVYGFTVDGETLATEIPDTPVNDVHPEIAKWRNIRQVYSSLGIVYGFTNDGRVVTTGRVKEEYGKYHGQDLVAGMHNIREPVDHEESSLTLWNGRLLCLRTDGTVASSEFVGVQEDTDIWPELSTWHDIQKTWGVANRVVGRKTDGSIVSTADCDPNDSEGRRNRDRQWEEASAWRDVVEYYDVSGRIIGLTGSGTVLVTEYYGSPDEGAKQTAAMHELRKWEDIAILYVWYSEAIIGITADGAVKCTGCWGQCLHEEMFDIDGWREIAALKLTFNYTIGVKRDGSLIAAGGFRPEERDRLVSGMKMFRSYDRLPEEIEESLTRTNAGKKPLKANNQNAVPEVRTTRNDTQKKASEGEREKGQNAQQNRPPEKPLKKEEIGCKKPVKKSIIFLSTVAACAALVCGFCFYSHYNGNKLMEAGNYEAALQAYKNDFIFSSKNIPDAVRLAGEDAFDRQDYTTAASFFAQLGDSGKNRWSDSVFEQARSLISEDDPESALDQLAMISEEERAQEQIGRAQLLIAERLFDEGKLEEAVSTAEGIKNTKQADAHSFLLKAYYRLGETEMRGGNVKQAVTYYKKCRGVKKAETNVQILETLRSSQYYKAAMMASTAVDEATTDFSRDDWWSCFQEEMGSCKDLPEFLDQNAALLLLDSEKAHTYSMTQQRVRIRLKDVASSSMIGNFSQGSNKQYFSVSDVDQLFKDCGNDPKGKILILIQRHTYSGLETQAVPRQLMELLPLERFPASLEEVEYVVFLTYDFEKDGSYQLITEALRENARIKIFRMPDGYVPYDTYQISGAHAPDSFSYYGTPPIWKSGDAPDMSEELYKAIMWTMDR